MAGLRLGVCDSYNDGLVGMGRRLLQAYPYADADQNTQNTYCDRYPYAGYFYSGACNA